MIRLILWNLFLFLLPFGVTMIWSRWLRRHHPPQERLKLMALCAVLGAAFVIVSLVFIRFSGEALPEGKYVPPVFEDGQLTPGHFD